MKIFSWKHILIQVISWNTCWLCILLILNTEQGFSPHFWLRTLLLVLGVSLIVFLNLKWLLPKLYFGSKKVLYFLSCAVLLMITVWGIHADLLPWNQIAKPAMEQVEEHHRAEALQKRYDSNDHPNYRWLIKNLTPLLISLLGSTLISMSQFAREKEKSLNQLEKAKLETEIKFLKSQINPHFLFNSLHNIYGLSIIQSDLGSPSTNCSASTAQ